MASRGKGTGIVGYNVVTHEVPNVGSDRDQLYKMAEKAREAMGTEELMAVADRGYFKRGILRVPSAVVFAGTKLPLGFYISKIALRPRSRTNAIRRAIVHTCQDFINE
jgi:hypothetical protein